MKYRNIIKTTSIVLLMFVLTSCTKDWLDVKPDKSTSVPTTLTDFQGLLDDVNYLNRSSPNKGELASDGHSMSDVVWQARVKNDLTDAYIWSHTLSHNNVFDWTGSYQKVLNCNIILDGLNKIKPSSPIEMETWNNIKGQALFNRGLTFYELAQIFSPPYDVKTANTDLGIVLRLSSDIALPSKRSTLKQTYDQIFVDLEEAEKLLSEKPAFFTRASKASVYALLARIYLAIENYDLSLENSNKALSLNSALIDFNTLPLNRTFIGRESNSEIIYLLNLSLTTILNSTNCLIDKSLYDTYDINDLRRNLFYRVNSNATITFIGNYDSSTSSIFSGLTTAEMYLIRAESFARKNRLSEALLDLNTLLKKRWNKNVVYQNVTAANADEALVKILAERKKELVLRGLRWTDLRRLNRDARFVTTLTRTIAGNTYTLEPNSYKYTFPMPDDILQQTGMQQNLGWP